MVVGLLIGQFVYSRPKSLIEGQNYLHTVPSGAKIFMLQAGSVKGFNRKLLGRSPGPLPISAKERTRFTFNIELFGFESRRLYVKREDLVAGSTHELEPKWGPLSWLLYNVRDYAFLYLASLLGVAFWLFWVRPQRRKFEAQEALWQSGQLQVGMRFHEYRLRERLGKGAAGEVFRADKPGESSSEKYTVKIFHRLEGKEDKQLEAALAREFQNCSELSHPGIVYLLDWGVHRGYYYLVSEFIEGVPLDEVSTYGLEDVCRWGIQLVTALTYAHSQGVVHRDIKPANIIRTADNRVKILDFGIAAKTDSEEESGAGSIGYMAPEQASGVVSPASDFYSVGVTLYRLASGRMPFDGEDYFQILAAQAKGEFAPLASIVTDCPAKLDQVVRRLLVKDSEDRLTDLDEIRTLLTDAMAEITPQTEDPQ